MSYSVFQEIWFNLCKVTVDKLCILTKWPFSGADVSQVAFKVYSKGQGLNTSRRFCIHMIKS